jgi:uncharacterized protein YdaL
MGVGRQLAALMGHFSVTTTLKGVNDYKSGQINGFDLTFYAGLNPSNVVPANFLNDVFSTTKKIVWLNTGFQDFSHRFDTKKRFGFVITGVDSVTGYDKVNAFNRTFTKDDSAICTIQITNPKVVEVVATATASRKRKEQPYILRSGNLLYFADSPMAFATPNGRYILFADMLHDILGEPHEINHQAIIRIEDITVFENPNALRHIADVLSDRNIPFLIGVVPFFVDPAQGMRLSISDKPELVDALQYMVHNGGTIVMHGVTHQYKGVTTADYEFWDEEANSVIKGETEDAIARKLESGIQEFMKNGLYPLVWETPHYTASFKLYRTVSKYFSTACEQRLSIEDFEYSQFFPFLIKKDLFGQTIFPENLGYVPLDSDPEVGKKAVRQIVQNAKDMLYLRDCIAGAFFHPFLDPALLEELVDGMQNLGYNFIDLREHTNWVTTGDRVILSGSQLYKIKLTDQYLLEAYYDINGELKSRTLSPKRMNGVVTRDVNLQPGEFFRAEPVEFPEKEPSFSDKLMAKAIQFYDDVFNVQEDWSPLRPLVYWNADARGAAYNDQASFAAVFRSVNVDIDTVFLGQQFNLAAYNPVIVPYSVVDSLKQTDVTILKAFVQNGGNIIIDTRTRLAEALGFEFTQSRNRVLRIRDRIFPEERIVWKYAELVSKFSAENIDRIFCVDEAIGLPMVVGKTLGKGKVLYFNSRFDPRTPLGYSHYPYLLEYVRRYFGARPIVRRDLLEMYFDPGFRHTYSIEGLVKMWVSQGIRIVHVSGWHEYPKYTYDYERLLRVAHANGILVFAWLEPPQVSQLFWQQHPEWREKNYKGDAVPANWRYLMAMTNDTCVAEIVKKFREFLQRYDWDGVNLAELYFESAKGFENPALYTPMHPTARADVKNKYGFDPVTLFDPQSPNYWKTNSDTRRAMTEYRVQKLYDLHELFLKSFQEIRQSKPGFQIIVTAMDNLGSPELREYHGIDIKSLIGLQHKYDVLLQIEDPQSRWTSDPRRYKAIGDQYAAIIGDRSRLMLDLNILTFRPKDSIMVFPTLIQTGTESFHLVQSAALGSPRLTIYAESSVNPQDLFYFPNALAANVTYKHLSNGLEVESRTSFVLQLPKEIKEIGLDGTWQPPYRDNRYLIPSGRHAISFVPASFNSFSTHQLQSRILSTTGELKQIRYGLSEIEFEYTSDSRALVSFNNAPSALVVDGEKISFAVMKGNDCYSVFLPPGTHKVTALIGGQLALGVNLTSFWSTTAIAIFSAVAVLLLTIMYFSLKIIRRTGTTKTQSTYDAS